VLTTKAAALLLRGTFDVRTPLKAEDTEPEKARAQHPQLEGKCRR
jgi:hypothetical protein